MHARPGNRLVDVEQVFAFAEAIQEDGHGAEVEAVGAQAKQVREDPGDLVEHHADVLGADRHLDTEQLLDRHHVGVLVAHHGGVVEPVHIRHCLDEGPVLGELLRGAMQQPDVRVGALDHLAVEFQHQPQHAVRGRVLRPEIHRVIAYFSHKNSQREDAKNAKNAEN